MNKKMKLKSCIMLVAMLTVVFTGCGSSEKEDTPKDKEPYIIEPFPEESGDPLAEFCICQSDINTVCESLTNIKVIGDVAIFLPKKASAVYRFTELSPGTVDMKAAYDEFLGLFASLFPGHTFHEDALLFYHQEEENYRKVFDFEDEIMSGKLGRVNLFYDETYLPEASKEWGNQVFLYTGYPAGYGATDVNKGKTASVVKPVIVDESNNVERCLHLSSFDPLDVLECVGGYTPDSTEKVKLLDGEIAINEAVAFYEDYVNNRIPYPAESNCRTAVWWVEVYRISEDVCGIAFLTTTELQNVPYDYLKNGTAHSGTTDSPIVGEGFMIETTDVDFISGFFRKTDAKNIAVHKDIMDFKDALAVVSQNLAGGDTFELRKIEFVYSRFFARTSEGYIDIENPTDEVIPEWKITLYSSKDDYQHICYVQAVDEPVFRYQVRYKEAT